MERVKLQMAKVVDGVVQLQYGTGTDGSPTYVPADDVVMLGTGQADSEGIAVIGETVTRYMTNTQVDTVFLLAKALEIATKAMDICNANFIISADNAISGQNTALTPIANELQTIINELEGRKLV